MSTYLKNMVGYKHNQLKSKSYDKIQEMFDKEMKNTELVKGSKTKAEGSSKRAGEELESDNQRIQDDEVAIDAIPLFTKPPVIVEWRNTSRRKDEKLSMIRAVRSSKRLLMKLEDSEDEHQVYGRIVRIKRLLGVNTTKVRVTAVKHNLVLLVIC
ncbi:hypothetical protein Tco_1343655 [Tanacetum coccineum]